MVLDRDVAYGLREVWRAPRFGVTYVAVAATVACMVALATAVVDSMILEPLPFAAAESTYQIVREQRAGDAEFETTRVSGAVIAAWSSLEGVDVAAVQDGRKETVFYHAGSDGALRFVGAAVSTGYFDLLGVLPWRGRTFTRHDVAQSAVILSYEAARRLSPDPQSLVGASLVLNDAARAVIGVMPPAFLVPAPPGHPEPDVRIDAWVPIEPGRDADADHVLVRSHAMTGAELSERLVAAERGLERTPTQRIRAVSLHDVIVGPAYGWARSVVVVAVIGLLFGMSTALGLVLVRRTGTLRQLALHRYFGATGAQLIARSAAATTVLAVAGSMCGLLVAAWLLDVLRSVGPSELARLSAVHLDVTSFALTLFTGLVLGMVSGGVPIALLLPWLPGSRALLSRTIGVTRTLQSFRSAVVIVQFCIACVFAVCGVMLTLGMRALHDRLPAEDADHILVVDLPRPLTSDAARNRVFYDDARRQIAALPGVRGVGLTSSVPLRARDYHGPRWSTRVVDDGYFGVLGVDVVRGRAFSPRDDAASDDVAILNESLAQQEFGAADPVGRSLDDRVIVGVVRDHAHAGLDREIGPALYLPVSQSRENRLSLLAAVTGRNTADVSARIREVVASIDVAQPIEEIESLATIARHSPALSHRAFQQFSLIGLTALATLLAVIGLGTVLAQYLAEHRSEIALRRALGGPPDLERRIVLRRTGRLLLVSLATGLPLAAALAHVLASSFHGIRPQDPRPYAAVITAFGVILMTAALSTPVTEPRSLLASLNRE